jgi:signal transduction histidine kinase/DNA-binding response OmpR family regulator
MNDQRGFEGGPEAFDCLAGGGETGALMRSLDWGATPLGPVGGWPRSLRTAVRIMLDSRYAMWLGWGADLTFFYNDSYARMTLGPKHPWAMGRPAREVWSEIWGDIGPRAESVLRDGQATWDEGLLLFLERRGSPEETYHTFSYSPVPDDRGGIGGMLCVVTEDTERTIGERRLRTLRELAARTSAGAKSAEEACRTAARTLAENRHDLPFVLVYLLDDDGAARLAGATGLPEGSPAAPPLIELSAAGGRGAGWPLAAARESGRPEVVSGLEERFGPLRCGPWPEPTRQAVVVPMAKPGQARPAGFVVAGVSPRLILDDGYIAFLGLMAGQIAASVANAQSYDEERRRAEALAELDRAKTAFFSNVSHEFRTPLTLMLGPAEDALADEVEVLPRRQLERVEIIHRIALRLLKLVNTLLDFSRIEAGRVQAIYEPTDLAALTADLASVFRSAVERAEMELVVDCPPLPEPAYVDRDMWEKIVLNLVSNAFKFTLEGRISVSLRAEGDMIALRVEDTGTGIPADELPRLFERFHRVEGARGRTHEGTGIGLALVQELARLHAGRVEVESAFGRGSCFTVTIPKGRGHLPADRIGGTRSLASTALGATPYVEEAFRWLPGTEGPAGPEDHAGLSRLDAPRQSGPGGERLRILLADDNADMREYLSRLLSERYDVTAVSDGMQALAAVRAQPPNLVLSDVMMPKLDGFGLLRELRADPASAAIPILLLSARAGEEARVEGLEKGADDYLTKPFGARELLARVAAHLELAQVRRNAARRERELRDEAESILESITDGFLALDAQWRITYLNAEAERIIDRPRAELLGGDHWELFPATVGTRLEWEFRRAVAEQTSVQVENYYEPWGKWFDVKAYPSRDGGLALYFRDVTRRKHGQQMERLLAEASATFASSLDYRETLKGVAGRMVPAVADLCIFDVAGRDGTLQRVAWAYADEAEGQDQVRELDRFVPPPGSADHPVARALATGRTELVVEVTDAWLRSAALDGQHLEFLRRLGVRSVIVAPIAARDKVLGALTLIYVDRSGRRYDDADRRFAEELARRAGLAVDNAGLYQSAQDARAEAEAASRMKDQFLATLSHELRTPLSAIVGWSRLLRSGKLDASDVEQGLDAIDRNAKIQTQLIEDLLDLSRIISGNLRLDIQRVSLTDVIDAALATTQPAAEAKGVRVVKIFDSLAGPVAGDPARLQQVVWNLLSNAVKFTPRGGRIQVLLERVNSHVEISITDTGIGIKPEFLPFVFDRFRQADGSTTRRHGGLGLGLSIVKQLVEMHGGGVRAKSPGENQGSTFSVSLPLLVVHDQEEDRRVRPKEPAAGELDFSDGLLDGVRVLVVDDEPDARELIRRVLVGSRAHVLVAGSAPQALEIVGGQALNVLVSDIGLPDTDGYDLMREVRARGFAAKDLPAVALTAFARAEDRRRALLAGFQVHVAKPVDPDELVAIVASLVGRTGRG